VLESARFLLSSEMAMARQCGQEEVEDELGGALAKCNLRWPEPEAVKV